MDDDDLVENPSTHCIGLDGRKIAKQTQKNGGVGAYKELIAMVEMKRSLAIDRKEKLTCFYEIKDDGGGEVEGKGGNQREEGAS